MKRRWAGLVLIVLVMVAAVALPHVLARTVSGVPQAVPVPGEPTAGDCLVDPPPMSFNVNNPAQGPDVYSQLHLAPCQGKRYGEVVSVTEPSAATGNPNGTIASSVLDTEACGTSAWTYLGLPARGSAPLPVFSYWYPLVSTGSFVTAPSARQQAAGQHWLACLVYLPSGNPELGTNIGYSGSMRNAFVTGLQRNLIGVCSNIKDLNGATPVPCSDAHQVEIFGTDYFIGKSPVSRAVFGQTCRRLIQKVTGLADVTGAGLLAVEVQATDPDGNPVDGPEIPASAYAECRLETHGGRKLSGSLIAWGDEPIPWT